MIIWSNITILVFNKCFAEQSKQIAQFDTAGDNQSSV